MTIKVTIETTHTSYRNTTINVPDDWDDWTSEGLIKYMKNKSVLPAESQYSVTDARALWDMDDDDFCDALTEHTLAFLERHNGYPIEFEYRGRTLGTAELFFALDRLRVTGRIPRLPLHIPRIIT